MRKLANMETHLGTCTTIKMAEGSMLSITIPGFEQPLLVWAQRVGTPTVRIASQMSGGVYSAVMTPEGSEQGAVIMTPKPRKIGT